ncbi:hypothetical protein ABE430_13820 [Brevibacillus agri]|uniref:hypothetical protein n=1 Tax=Brevibacillus agri TaxID=51101 RepID=UPI003D214054
MMDLVARLRIKDDMSEKLSRVTSMATRLSGATRKLANLTRQASEQFNRTGQVADGMTSSLSDLGRAQSLAGTSAASLAKSLSQVDAAAEIGARAMTTYRDSAGRLRDEFGRFVPSGKQAGGAFDGIAGSATRARGAILGLKSTMGGVLGLAAGYGVYRGAESFLTSALGGAANYELATVQIGALFQDEKKAKTYMERMSAAAALSPILNEQQVFDNSKSFLALTKDQNTLESMWKVAEKLTAMDPAQGLEGAVLAMRELAGGDVQSLVERFELPRKLVNQWKNLPIEKQAKAMNSYLDSIGFNQKFLEKTGATAAKQWDRTTELLQRGMRIIGQDALTKLKPALVDINNFLSSPRFDAFVSKVGTGLAGMFDGLIASAKSVWSYLDSHYFSNPKFGQLPDISSKVAFIFSDLSAEFSKWYANSGSKQVSAATTRITTTILDGLNNAAPAIGQAAVNIGGKIAIGIMDGINQMGGPLEGLAEWLGLPTTTEKYNAIQEKLKRRDDATERIKYPQVPVIYGPPAPIKTDASKYHGLDYVPRDGYTARLHKGERVLTAQENREYSGGGGGVTIAKLADQIVVREEADIERIAYRLAREIVARRS